MKTNTRKFLVYLLVVVVVIVAILEIASRVILSKLDKGYHCFEISKIEPYSPIVADSTYGYSLKDGNYSFTNQCGLTFAAQHYKGERVPALGPDSSSKGHVLVFGDSNIYGYGVEDSCTMPYYLQQLLPEYRIRNMGVPGWSALVSFLKLRDLLNDSNTKAPALVIFQLADYDGGRITLTPMFLDAYKSENIERRHFDLPYAYLKNDSLCIAKKSITNGPNALADISALVNIASRYYLMKVSFSDEQIEEGNRATEALLREIVSLCLRKKIKLLVAGYQLKEKRVERFKGICTLPEQDIYFTNFTKPEDESLTLMPNDNHPSAKGHQYYAQILAKSIITDSILAAPLDQLAH
jgi:lysophospholipase L1-like esterase